MIEQKLVHTEKDYQTPISSCDYSKPHFFDSYDSCFCEVETFNRFVSKLSRIKIKTNFRLMFAYRRSLREFYQFAAEFNPKK